MAALLIPIMTCQPSCSQRFFPATGPDGEPHFIIECAGNDVNELEIDARYLLKATGQSLSNLGGGVFVTSDPSPMKVLLAQQASPGGPAEPASVPTA